MKEFSIEELAQLPDLPLSHISAFIDLPSGYVCKLREDFGPHLLFNPSTNHVITYYYWESPCYGDNASDIQYNGHYSVSQDYTAK